MYTIFIEDIPIYLTENIDFSSKNNFYSKDEITIENLLKLAKSKTVSSIYLYHNDLKELWKEFKWFFKIEKAAGGKVNNEKGEILFIYRFDKWDLPKGKIEKREKKKEAAIREVEEECGISGLEIIEKLPKTYHVFQRNGRETLKITYWYAMKTKFNGELTAQEEEGITDVVFKNKDEIAEALQNTYGNIQLLFN
ncbi:NUDIX hydrolase [Urechidicola vernalis]|uniref:NUDIX domain-containing protein n=1 Tax=Urechidicola vernalis TaxID=3075600 RepID=A0ABU2Y2I6_9FLAO|nr:NUDIX domain-containing protein [Urechidicola sp. P050]MDT0552412.1 NUDIX domain-containing protein [Urechidicola sp. P050]